MKTNKLFPLRSFFAAVAIALLALTAVSSAQNIATLSDLTFSGGTFDIPFDGSTNYTATVPYAITNITVTPTATDPVLPTITVDGNLVASGTPSGSISLGVGATNVITTVVVSQDLSATNTYTLTVTRSLASPDATLSDLTFSGGTFDTPFNGTFSYTATVPYATASVTVTPTSADGTATITVDGITNLSGVASGPISLGVGATNVITTVVISQDSSATNTYTLTVTRDPASTNADLANLVPKVGTLTPAFDSNTLSYTVTVPAFVATLAVRPTVADPTATVAVNGNGVASGSFSSPITLNDGATVITNVVTAEDATTTKTYQLTVTRLAPTNGTWVVDAGGLWTDSVNWLDGIVAGGINATGFLTANITAARTVTNIVSGIIGNLTFTDSTTASSDLTLFGTGVNSNLTLAVTSGKPVIDVTQLNRQLTLNCVISGTSGFQKNGLGVLNLGGSNNYTGTTVANGAILSFGSINMDGFGGGPGSRSILVTPSNIVQRTHSVLNNAFLNRLVQTNYEFGVFLTASGAADVGTGITNDFSSSTGANLPNAFLGSWAGNGGQCRYNGVIIPASDNYRLGFPGHAGALSIMQPHGDVGGTPRGLIVGGGTPVLANVMTFSGDTVLRAGRLFLGNNLALQNSVLNVGTGTDGITGQICFLASNVAGAPTSALTDQPTFGGLVGSRGLASIYNSANQNNTTRLLVTGVLGLTLNVATNRTCTYSGNVRLATGMYLTKTGPGTQILSGNSDYTGPTTISAGTLTLSGMVSNTTASVTVADGATLNVSGKGATPAINSPGDLTLGTSGACTLGFSGLTSTNVAPVNVNNLVANGTVTINISGGLGIGQLPLIKYTTALSGAGTFALSPLPPGYSANLVTNTLNQSLDLDVTGAPVSIITDLPTNTIYRFVGGSYSQSVVAGGTPPLTYLWSHDGTPVGSNSPALTLSNLVLADGGGYSVMVTNATTSAQSSTNNLVVLTPSTYDSLVLASGPLAFWPLNEASGPTAFDQSANYDGAYSGNVTYSVPGPASNTVVTVDGVVGKVTIPYSPALNPTNAFSVELWAKPALVPRAVGYIASSVQVSGNRSGWYLTQDDGVTFAAGSAFVVRLFNLNGSTNSIQLSTPVTDTNWYYLVLTYDGNTAALYANGVLATNGVIGPSGFVGNVSAPLTVGVRSDGNTPWPGSVGGLALYGRALTSTEVAQHSLAAPVTPSPALLTNSFDGTTLSLSWPAGEGWRLEYQTNALSVGLATNWMEAAGISVSATNITVDSAQPTVFYRLIYP